MIKAAVLGYGNIGSGVVQVLLRNREVIAEKAGEEIVPVCVLDLRDFPGDVMEDKVVRDINIIVNDPEIKVVVETMGGTKPAYGFVKACLEAGKHVATSNKELVAAHGEELLHIAEEHHVNFLFEASVGGGIPIIRALTSSITADDITEITGILNGTTNYMLTRMSEDGLEYAAVLEDAQERGFAERNPAADVEGYDACRKIAILSSLAFGHFVDYNDVDTEGITGISAADIAYAAAAGKKIKLFGTSKKAEDGSISAMVCPVMAGREHPLYSVDGVMNAVLVRGKLMGDLMFYGAGAGKFPTACAVAEDVVSAVRRPQGTEIRPYKKGKLDMANGADCCSSYFVRIPSDTDMNKAAEAFRAVQTVDAGFADEIGIITGSMRAGELDELAEKFRVINKIRIAE